MATMRNIIDQALQKARVKGVEDNSVAAYAADAMTQLNMMLHDWKLAGVDLEYADAVESDEFPLGPEFQSGVVYLLAQRIAPDYQAPIGFDADDYFRKIQAAYLTIEEVTMPKALTELPGIEANSRYYTGS